MRDINVKVITENIKEMCIEANHVLAPDMRCALKNAKEQEKAPLGKQILSQLEEKVNKHNNLIERTFKLEGRMDEAEHDIRDLKRYHTPKTAV